MQTFESAPPTQSNRYASIYTYIYTYAYTSIYGYTNVYEAVQHRTGLQKRSKSADTPGIAAGLLLLCEFSVDPPRLRDVVSRLPSRLSQWTGQTASTSSRFLVYRTTQNMGALLGTGRAVGQPTVSCRPSYSAEEPGNLLAALRRPCPISDRYISASS